MIQLRDVSAVARTFQISGDFVSATPFGSGHINDTYCAVFHQGGSTVRFILQRINHIVFKDPVKVMENIQRVTAHIADQVADVSDRHRRVLALIPARDGQAWHVDIEGNYWRAYRFIESAGTYEAVESAHQAFQAARAFGHFQKQLSNLPSPRLHDTITDFHHTPKRFAAFEKALAIDSTQRASLAKPEIDFALARQPLASALLRANLPERVTHNDTKLNNVLLDDSTGQALCVIDLDTVMPGLALYDFGDMVRTTTSPTREDELDLSKVTLQFPMFEALVRGYLSSAGDFLTPSEKNHLVCCTKVITFEQGIRFLSDYLAGDPYYKVHREGHNLDRCRTQFRLLQSIENQEAAMEHLIRNLTA